MYKVQKLSDELIIPEDYNIMESASHNLDLLKLMSARDIIQAYVANMLAAAVLRRAGDKQGETVLRDNQNKRLTRYNQRMSVLNFWGLVVHNSKNQKVNKALKSSVAKELHKSSGRIQKKRIKDLHSQLSTSRNIKWNDVNESIRVMTLRLPLRTSRVNKIREGLEHWAELDGSGRADVIKESFLLLMQYDQNSELLPKIRTCTDNSMLSTNKVTDVVKKVSKLKEDDGGGTGAGDAGADGAVTSTGDVGGTASGSYVPFKLFRNKIVKRVKRNYTRKKKYDKKRKKRS